MERKDEEYGMIVTAELPDHFYAKLGMLKLCRERKVEGVNYVTGNDRKEIVLVFLSEEEAQKADIPLIWQGFVVVTKVNPMKLVLKEEPE